MKIGGIKKIKNLADWRRQRSWRRQSAERGVVIFLAVILLCAAGVAVFLNHYFKAYKDPYMKREVFSLSEGWQYQRPGTSPAALDSLSTGPYLQGGETLTIYRRLDIELPEAAIMIRANHQAVNMYLDGVPLFLDKAEARVQESGQNPGMALHFILLPDDYLYKTLKIEITSPYTLYSGRTSPILLGTIPSLEAHTVSSSMRPLILMAMCLALGITVIAFTFVQALNGAVHREQLALGVFMIIWALYYVCTEYIVFQFFTPLQMSVFSLGLYFSFQAPLSLFFYFSFERYKKWMLPAVILHCAFVATALALQFLGLVDLPRLLNVNNILLAALLYTLILAVLEAVKKNFMMILAAPFLAVAYGFMLFNFYAFYKRQGAGLVPSYSYRDPYFLLVLAVLVFNIWRFFWSVYRQRREIELLSLQKRLAQDSYEQIKTHLKQIGGLKHEVRNHLAALRTYLEDGRVEEARSYLNQYAAQAGAVTDTVFSDSFLINAVVSGLLHRAEEHGVKVDLNLKAAPSRIADPDLYSLFSNILDNALEACVAMPERGERFIRLSVTQREPYLIIRCENSKSGEIISVDNKLQTSKAGDGHGYGLWMIESIVNAYDGMMNIKHDDNTFTLTAALKDK